MAPVLALGKVRDPVDDQSATVVPKEPPALTIAGDWPTAIPIPRLDELFKAVASVTSQVMAGKVIEIGEPPPPEKLTLTAPDAELAANKAAAQAPRNE